MKYVEVAVDAPLGVNRTLTYGVPPRMEVSPGQLVWVPLGPRPVQGMVFETSEQTSLETTRPVISTIAPGTLLPSWGLELARWLSRYYLSSLFEAAALMLPPGFRTRVRAHVGISTKAPPGLTDEESTVYEVVSQGERRLEREVVRVLGRKAGASLDRLVRRGFLERDWEIVRPQTAPRYERYLLPHVGGRGPKEALAELKGAPRQEALLAESLKQRHGISYTDAMKGFGPSAVSGLVEKGMVAQEWVRGDGRRRSLDLQMGLLPTLTAEQSSVASFVRKLLVDPRAAPRSVLLHGVTGSGKTEVYLRALERCIGLGRRGILLVPEISMTPQMEERINERFPGRVALLHSGMSLQQRFEAWWRIRAGVYDVVVGPRSALFSPVPNLGLIVIDEEHEWNYKEENTPPRYHARETARKISQLSGAPVLMGSATPDVATYYHSLRGRRHRLFKLPYRIGTASPENGHSPREAAKGASQPDRVRTGLARVVVEDMREELKMGNRSPFSRRLTRSLTGCVGRGEQAILFLNRRGAASMVQCRDCGLALECRRCSVAVTYHRGRGLLCHLCGRRRRPSATCEECGGRTLRYLGVGTQKVVEELERVLPGVGVVRWDSDAAGRRGEHEALLKSFAAGEAQVLVGTQMVAKGLHVPNVSLVGVVLADVGLHRPDFRAGERTFQLLCQVAGRAGRGRTPGLVVIQTYSPESYTIRAAGRQDYSSMYKREIAYRRELGYPPFSRLIRLVYQNIKEDVCEEEAKRMAEALQNTAYGRGLAGVDVVGPAPTQPRRIRGLYRWHLILRGTGGDLHSLLGEVGTPRGWTVDVDPVTSP